MKEYVEGLEREFSAIERGFLREQRRARSDYASFDPEQARRVAFLAYRSEAYQVRMYAVFLLGHLSQESDVLSFLRDDVSADSNWRVQEVLAKAFDDFCAVRGYEAALPVIDEWLSDSRPNVRRAVTEGLRIWTSRPYFRDHPGDAIARLSKLRSDASEYVRKSVGNALRDISKKHPELVAAELRTWSLETTEVAQVYRLASTLISCATAER
ncbi:HEAT repeat domain-containing protein [Pauljensenia sp. 20925_1_25]|uniref:HEAT repeat domain-containing protein n=1 Tax=Pauljensenia sp. 20925_1_25 TaxID=3003692 RepID=UPI0028E9FDF6|nr:DNA alkylation repair protein [uncultured Actinomyces sp.]